MRERKDRRYSSSDDSNSKNEYDSNNELYPLEDDAADYLMPHDFNKEDGNVFDDIETLLEFLLKSDVENLLRNRDIEGVVVIAKQYPTCIERIVRDLPFDLIAGFHSFPINIDACFLLKLFYENHQEFKSYCRGYPVSIEDLDEQEDRFNFKTYQLTTNELIDGFKLILATRVHTMICDAWEENNPSSPIRTAIATLNEHDLGLLLERVLLSHTYGKNQFIHSFINSMSTTNVLQNHLDKKASTERQFKLLSSGIAPLSDPPKELRDQNILSDVAIADPYPIKKGQIIRHLPFDTIARFHLLPIYKSDTYSLLNLLYEHRPEFKSYCGGYPVSIVDLDEQECCFNFKTYQLTTNELIAGFNLFVATKCHETTYAVWGKNDPHSPIRAAVATLDEDSLNLLTHKVLTSSRSGMSPFIHSFITTITNINVLKKHLAIKLDRNSMASYNQKQIELLTSRIAFLESQTISWSQKTNNLSDKSLSNILRNSNTHPTNTSIFMEQLKDFKQQLSDRSYVLAKKLWENNPDLVFYFIGEKTLLLTFNDSGAPEYITLQASSSELIEHLKIALISQCTDVIRAIWGDKSSPLQYTALQQLNQEKLIQLTLMALSSQGAETTPFIVSFLNTITDKSLLKACLNSKLTELHINSINSIDLNNQIALLKSRIESLETASRSSKSFRTKEPGRYGSFAPSSQSNIIGKKRENDDNTLHKIRKQKLNSDDIAPNKANFGLYKSSRF